MPPRMPTVKNFPALIKWIADTYHHGVIMHVGASVGISQATAHKWVTGRALPTLPKLFALCDAYHLDLHWVVDLVKATTPARKRIEPVTL